jgi:hypothetical protein
VPGSLVFVGREPAEALLDATRVVPSVDVTGSPRSPVPSAPVDAPNGTSALRVSPGQDGWRSCPLRCTKVILHRNTIQYRLAPPMERCGRSFLSDVDRRDG